MTARIDRQIDGIVKRITVEPETEQASLSLSERATKTVRQQLASALVQGMNLIWAPSGRPARRRATA